MERDAMSMNDSGSAQDTGTSPEQLRSEIEQTGADLGDDGAASTEKVNPRARMSRAVSTARGNVASATSRARQAAPRTARQAGQTVRDHPMPVAAGALALAGASATALLIQRRAVKARAARKRAAAGPWSALAGAAATALLARRRVDQARTARTRAAAGPWFRR
jgi:ElaB/YqjD/DUF883 family membrane-anchored ribosome-binding protein